MIDQTVGNRFELIVTGEDFLNRTLETHTLRSTVNKWDFRKLKCFCTAKDITMQCSSLQNGKRSFPIIHLIGGYYLKYIKNQRYSRKQKLYQENKKPT